MKRLIFLVIIALPLLANATQPPQWFQRHAEGWFWYIDPPQEDKQEEPDATPTPPPPPTSEFDPKAELKAFQQQLEDAQAQAIMSPTEANVITYLYLQKRAMDLSQSFSETWQRVVWTPPAPRR